MLELHPPVARQEHRARQALLQLPHVERPAVEQQGAGGIGGEDQVAGHLAGLFHQRREDQPEVLAPLAQRSQHDPGAVEAGEQIAPEAVLCGERAEIAVGGRDHPQIHLHRPRSSNGEHLALLQHAQERRLGGQRQVADLVEQQRSVLAAAHESWAILQGAGEGALAVSEQLGLDEVGRDCPAVHGHERAGTTRELVDGRGDQFLAGAGLAGNEHRHLRTREGRHTLQLEGERGRERSHPARQRLERALFDERRLCAGKGLAEDEEAVPQLDQRAVGQRRGGHALAIDERTVLGAGVFDHPRPEHPLQPRVPGGHAAVGEGDPDR